MAYELRILDILQGAAAAQGGVTARNATAWSGTFHARQCEGSVGVHCVRLDDGSLLQVLDYRVASDLSVLVAPLEQLGITFCAAGEVNTTLGRSTTSRRLCGGEIAVTSPSTECGRKVAVNANRRTRIVHVDLARSHLDTLLRELSLDLPEHIREGLKASSCAMVVRCFARGLHRLVLEQMLDAPYEGPTRWKYLEVKLEEFLTTFWADARLANNGGTSRNLTWALRRRLDRARSILYTNLSDTPSIAELARAVCLSESTLSHGFRAYFGCSVLELVKSERLERGRRLLMKPHRGVAQVAFEVGYSSPSRFACDFRARFGVPPRRLRNGATVVAPEG